MVFQVGSNWSVEFYYIILNRQYWFLNFQILALFGCWESVWEKEGNCIIWIATVSLFLLFMLWGSNEFHSTQPNSLASSSSENSKWTPQKKKPIQFVAF